MKAPASNREYLADAYGGQHADAPACVCAGDLEDSCLVVGTSSGWLQLHSHDGTLLHRQQLHTLPVAAVRIRCQKHKSHRVVEIKLRCVTVVQWDQVPSIFLHAHAAAWTHTHRPLTAPCLMPHHRASGMGVNQADEGADVTVVFADAAARVSGLEVRSVVRLQRQSWSDPDRLDPLGFTKWDLKSAGELPRASHGQSQLPGLPTRASSAASMVAAAYRQRSACQMVPALRCASTK